jgi:hypothetical protein
MFDGVMNNTLKSQIIRLIECSADTNQTCLTLSPEFGWNVSFHPGDREDDAVVIANKDAFYDWANEGEWTDEHYDLAEEWVRDNVGDWLRDTDITSAQLNSHL